MLKCILFFNVVLFFNATLFAQTPIDTIAIKNELSEIYDKDQSTRTSPDLRKYLSVFDSTNLVQVDSLITKYGWPGKSFVGAKGNNTVFLVIQHADLATQEKYFPMMQKSVEENESRACDLALLQDRILMRQGKKQIYGSQISFNKQTKAQEIWPIEDEKNVNVRREKAGLPTMEVYAKFFGIEYLLPKE